MALEFNQPMHFWRVYRSPLMFIAALLVGSFLVLRQVQRRELDHVERREDFILLQEKGHTKRAQWYYQRLVEELNRLPDHLLWDDYQRTILVVDPKVKQLDNLVWKYHWAVKNQIDLRSQKRLEKLVSAEEKAP